MLENIIFDLGGVLLKIEMGKTKSSFIDLGWKEEEWKGVGPLGSLLFENLEIGVDTPIQFRENIRKILPGNPTDDEIDQAWNAMLIDFPEDIVSYLSLLKRRFKLYLLSNTNELHLQKFNEIFENKFGYPLNQLFVKCYFSHEIGFRKPGEDAFETVIKDAKLKPELTLFVDDLKANTETAERLGMQVLSIEPNTLMNRLPIYLESLSN